MERREVLEMMTALKLAGMRAAYDDILATCTPGGSSVVIRCSRSSVRCCRPRSPTSRRAPSSTRWRPPSCQRPAALADFDFAASPVNEPLIRELAGGGFLEGKRNIVLVGGTGTKTHLAVAVARSCIRKGARGRCYNVVDLVNHLEAETPRRTPGPHRRPARPPRLRHPRRARLPALRHRLTLGPAGSCSSTS